MAWDDRQTVDYYALSPTATALMTQFCGPDPKLQLPPESRETMPAPTDEITGRREPIWAGALALKMRLDKDAYVIKTRDHVNPSDAMKCGRQLAYKASGFEGAEMDDSGIVNTTTGDYLHGEWQEGLRITFEAMRYLWMVERGDELPAVGVPWRVEIEMEFKTSITVPDGPEVPISGRADAAIFDAYDNLIEIIDAKSQGGFGYKKTFEEGVGTGPWVQSWSYAKAWCQNFEAVNNEPPVLEPIVTVMNLAKDHVSVGQASRYKASQTERWANEFSKPMSFWDATGFAEMKRMWGINRLVVNKGDLAKRMIPEYGNGGEIVSPQTGTFEDTTHGWQCDYCSFRERCIKDGPGRVPIPETSLVAIRRREGADKLAEAFPGATVEVS